MAESQNVNAARDFIDRHVERGLGDKPAFVDPRRSLTYASLAAGTRRMGRLLRRLGLRREERIALAMLDTVDWPVVFLGAIRAGVVPVALNTLLTGEHYDYMLRDCRARALFVSAALLPVLEPILGGLPDLAHIVVVDGEGIAAPRLDFATALAAEDDRFETAATHRDEPAFWLYSSGSTGNPKGTRHVHASLGETARLYGQGILGIAESDIGYSAAKLFFAYGLGNSLSFPLSVGASVILEPGRPTPGLVFDLLEKHRPTLFHGVPTLYAAMLGDPALAGRAGSPRLRLAASAGEALPAHIGQAWKTRFGCDILDGLGSTEMLHIFLSNRVGDVAYGTSGRAVPGYDLSLRDDAGREIEADGEIGELFVRGPTAAADYWNQRARSRATFQGEWTKTGDKYTRDADGRYTYAGRADDMFKVSGIWVSPFEVETALISHPAVLEAAVVPAMDDENLVKPKAFVVLKPGVSTEGLNDSLKEHVKAKAGLWKYPRWIVFAESLPKTATGKIQRFKLRS